MKNLGFAIAVGLLALAVIETPDRAATGIPDRPDYPVPVVEVANKPRTDPPTVQDAPPPEPVIEYLSWPLILPREARNTEITLYWHGPGQWTREPHPGAIEQTMLWTGKEWREPTPKAENGPNVSSRRSRRGCGLLGFR